MDIMKMISQKDLLDFSQNLSVTRNYMGDRYFPDTKTEHFEAEYYRLSDGLRLPSMAKVHSLNTEAAIGKRPTFERVTVEKLFIKEKINQTERVQLYLDKGVSTNSILEYVYDDMGRLAESVKTRTEVMKMELLSSGEITVKENNLNFKVDYKVPANQKVSYNWSDTKADILGDIQNMVDIAKSKGKTVNRAITSTKIMGLIRKNETIQAAINGNNGVGRFVSNIQIATLLNDVFSFNIEVNDEQYKYEKASGKDETARYFAEDKFTLIETSVSGTVGTGLWGVTPEELAYGPYTTKSSDQYITISQWQTPDPVATWTKASGLFIPVLPDPTALTIATITM